MVNECNRLFSSIIGHCRKGNLCRTSEGPVRSLISLSHSGANIVGGSWSQRRSFLMSKKAVEHHHKAAEHHEHAARHHKEAAKHHEAGKHETAAHHAHLARGHHEHAMHHAAEAAKAHVEDHGAQVKTAHT